MTNAPIIDQLLKLNNQDIVSFHVPGHKNGRIYNKISYKNFQDIAYNLDTTEIPGTDNLHNAQEVIKQSQDKASKIFKSEETFFLVNGSTAGIYSMIMASTCPGDKILIDRNCHQSVINASILGDLVPIYVCPNMDEKQGIAMGILPEDIEKQLMEHSDIKAVILTYPTYHGIACDLKKIREIVHKYDKILLIDEAHGAHFGLSEHLPLSALSCGADGVVQSTHKTLPSFTQSSMLHVQGNRIDREKLRFMLRIHQSSSPSYLLLSSLDFAVMVYETEGKYLMKALLENINTFREKVYKLNKVSIMSKDIIGIKGVHAIDHTRLWFGLKGITGYKLEQRLRDEFNIQMELSNDYGVLAVTSIANDTQDFDRLLSALDIISKEETNKGSDELQSFIYKMPEQVITPRKALYKSRKRVLLKESSGYTSGEYIIPYPPGIPLIVPGEKINDEVIEYVTAIIQSGKEILGLKDTSYQWIEVLA